jgi:hypothetical protein
LRRTKEEYKQQDCHSIRAFSTYQKGLYQAPNVFYTYITEHFPGKENTSLQQLSRIVYREARSISSALKCKTVSGFARLLFNAPCGG